MNQSSIAGKTALITGASSGIGKACAEQFASQGVHVVLTARRLDRIEKIAKELSSKHGIKALPLQLDVQKNSQVETVFQELEKKKVQVDILLNNAGLALTTDLMQDGKVHNWDVMIDTNLKGLLYITRAFLPSMVKRNQGHIINIGSVAGHGCYVSGNIYSATKHAVRAITQSLRLDLMGTAIRVSEVDPGAVRTEFSEVRWNDKQRADKFYEDFTPLSAHDIADAVLYCATRPPHVNIAELIVYPQAQASLTNLYRQGQAGSSPFDTMKCCEELGKKWPPKKK
jgi:NADP-dependent 3-hydroxy acid dehydrogenase YdfG